MSSNTMTINKSNILDILSKNEPISDNLMNIFLNGCLFSNDIELAKSLVKSQQMFELFLNDNIYYSHQYEIYQIMMKIANFNNIDMIDSIMSYTNNYIDNDKQQETGCYIAAYLYKYNFDTTATEIINKYYLNYGEIITNMYKIVCSFDKIKEIISNNHESIKYSRPRKWLLSYSARNDDIEMIKFLKQYYVYTEDDIFGILFNFSKSTVGSKELYIYIFNNYIDIIKNETLTFKNLITELFYAENLELIYFILSKIQFDEMVLIDILTNLFDYNPFFDEIIKNITDIMLNVWKMKTIELKKLYYQINIKDVYDYIQEHL